MQSYFAHLSTQSLANTPRHTSYNCAVSTSRPILLCMQSIAIREASDGQIIVAGAKDEPAESYQEAIRLLEIGSLSRSTGKSRHCQQHHINTYHHYHYHFRFAIASCAIDALLRKILTCMIIFTEHEHTHSHSNLGKSSPLVLELQPLQGLHTHHTHRRTV